MKIPEIAHNLAMDPALVLRILRQLGLENVTLDTPIPATIRLRTEEAIVLINSYQLEETARLMRVIDEKGGADKCPQS